MRRSPTGWLAFVAILTVGLIAAGCGSSNSSSTTSTTALTKAEFLKQGNAICKKGNQQINKVGHQTFSKKKYPNGPPPKSALTKFTTDTAIPTIQTEIDGVKALGAPAGDEAQVKAIVDSAQSALDKAKADPTVLFQNNPKNDPFAKSNQLANSYGLTACGGG
jgi:hypothetical protein